MDFIKSYKLKKKTHGKMPVLEVFFQSNVFKGLFVPLVPRLSRRVRRSIKARSKFCRVHLVFP